MYIEYIHRAIDNVNAQEHVKQVEQDVKQKQEMLRKTQAELQEGFDRERKAIEDKLKEEQLRLERANKEAAIPHYNLETGYNYDLRISDHNNDVDRNSYSSEEMFDDEIKKHVKKIEAKPSPPREIGQDLWRQLRRVSIPVFIGDKRNYENWK